MIEAFNNDNNNLCINCKLIEDKIINSMKSCDEYRRSLAVSEAFNFLLNKIKLNEESIKEYKKNEENLNKQIKEMKYEIIEKDNQLEQIENDHVQKQFLMKNKIDNLTAVNKNLQNKISDLEQETYNLTNLHIEKEKELVTNLKQLHLNEEEKLKSKIEKMENNLEENLNNFKEEKQKMKDSESSINKKCKDLELLIYKLDMQNQDYKHNLRIKLQNEQNVFQNELLKNIINRETINNFNENLRTVQTIETNENHNHSQTILNK